MTQLSVNPPLIGGTLWWSRGPQKTDGQSGSLRPPKCRSLPDILCNMRGVYHPDQKHDKAEMGGLMDKGSAVTVLFIALQFHPSPTALDNRRFTPPPPASTLSSLFGSYGDDNEPHTYYLGAPQFASSLVKPWPTASTPVGLEMRPTWGAVEPPSPSLEGP